MPRTFDRIAIATVMAVFFLILVGGIVRASGAGMGCPDWPTCFGRWIPPTSVAQLPSDYKEIYAHLGYADTDFNAIKTWTEYLNRLVGVAIGLMITATALCSLHYRRRRPGVSWAAWLALLAVGFQGWLGSAVVASNLNPWLITLHMVMALAIVALLIYATAQARSQRAGAAPSQGCTDRRIAHALLLAMAFTLVQITLGTQVREAVDELAHASNYADRHLWRAQLPTVFYVHRALAPVILFLNLWLAYRVASQLRPDTLLFRFSLSLAGLVLLALASGLILDRFGLPAFAQPLHLTLASLIFGNQFYLFIHLRFPRRAGRLDALQAVDGS